MDLGEGASPWEGMSFADVSLVELHVFRDTSRNYAFGGTLALASGKGESETHAEGLIGNKDFGVRGRQ